MWCTIYVRPKPVICGMDASLETRTLQMLFASRDQKEGMGTFIEKRKPKFTGH